MAETLQQQLALDTPEREEDSLEVILSDEEIRERQFGVLEEYFSNDEFALSVAKKETSYKELLWDTFERYDSFKKRIWFPKYDSDADSRTSAIISSMKGVGFTEINPDHFRTGERAKNMIETYCVTGGLALFYALTGFVGSSAQDPALISKVLLGGALPAFASGSMALVNHIGRTDLADLKKGAEERDKFLQENQVIQEYVTTSLPQKKDYLSAASKQILLF